MSMALDLQVVFNAADFRPCKIHAMQMMLALLYLLRHLFNSACPAPAPSHPPPPPNKKKDKNNTEVNSNSSARIPPAPQKKQKKTNRSVYTYDFDFVNICECVFIRKQCFKGIGRVAN